MGGHSNLVADCQGPVVENNIKCCPETPFLLDFENSAGPGTVDKKREFLAHVPLSQSDHYKKEIRYTLPGMCAYRHDRKVALEVRDPVEPVS